MENININEEIKKISDYFKNIASEDYILVQAHNNIAEIIQKDLPHKFTGWYNDGEKKIYIDKKKVADYFEECLLHEMLHAITIRSKFSKGFKRPLYQDGKFVKSIGIGLDEGITQTIAEEIAQTKNKKSYLCEKSIYKFLKIMAGEENLLSDYMLGTNKTEEYIKQNYKPEMLINYRQLNHFLDTANYISLNMSRITEEIPNYEEKLKKMQDAMDFCYKATMEPINTMGKIFNQKQQERIAYAKRMMEKRKIEIEER